MARRCSGKRGAIGRRRGRADRSSDAGRVGSRQGAAARGGASGVSEYGYPPIDRAGLRHAYEQVTDTLAARIAAGYYTVKLPRELHLAEEFGVSYTTMRRAMAILRERGLIVSIHGRGTFVAPEHREIQTDD